MKDIQRIIWKKNKSTKSSWDLYFSEIVYEERRWLIFKKEIESFQSNISI